LDKITQLDGHLNKKYVFMLKLICFQFL
jgi:hypothetical protein